MSKTVVTARVEPALAARIDELAARLDRTRGWVIDKAIDRYVTEELEFLAFVQVGIDDLDAGRTVSHEELVASLRNRNEGRKAA